MKLIFRIQIIIFLTGCTNQIAYNPIITGDSPTSPGSAWECQRLNIHETTKNYFTEEDLSKQMCVSDLLDIALFNNPSTRVSWNAARAAAYGYQASLSEYYPALTYLGNVTSQKSVGIISGISNTNVVNPGNANATTTTTGTGSTSSSSSSSSSTKTSTVTVFNELMLSYLLLDFGGRDAQADLALQTLYAANWEHNFVLQQVMMAVLNDYTSYLGNKGLVEGFEQDLKDAEVALNAAEVMKRAGLATLTDVLLAQSNLEQTRLSLEQARGAEYTSYGELMITLGLPPDTQLDVERLPDELPVVEIEGNVTTLFELAKKRRPDLGVALAAVKEQQAQLVISYSAGMPTVTANATSSYLHFVSPKMVHPNSRTQSAFFEFNWPIFQGFFYLNQQRQIRAQIDEALANLDVQIATVATEIVTNFYAFKTAVASLPASIALLDSSERAFKGALVQYKTGTASILDVLTALTTLSNARAQVVLTRTQWAAALANLAFAAGVLEDTSAEWRKKPPEQLYKLKYEGS